MNNNQITKEIITEIPSRNDFIKLLGNNCGLIIIKFGASWCGPCKLIKKSVDGFFATSPPNVICCDIDVDVSFDIYSFLKSKKMVNGVPVLLCYKKGNNTYIPDDIVSGADPKLLHEFFIRCGKHLVDALDKNPL